jgi:hypothetical protein
VLEHDANLPYLTAEDFIGAGETAAAIYSDNWIGCNILRNNQQEEPDVTVVVEYRGILFEVWLESRLQRLIVAQVIKCIYYT